MTCHSGGTLEIFVDPYIPVPRALLIGHGPVVDALAGLAGAADFDVEVCALGSDAGRSTTAKDVSWSLDSSRIAPDERTYVVVATHGQADEEALNFALSSKAPYVALVASNRRAAVCKENLVGFGLTANQVGRLHAPAGLDIGAVTPGEIAVSILAQMVQARRAAPCGVASVDSRAVGSEGGHAPSSAVDPVCGMSVLTTDNAPSVTYQGHIYYFCCSGCRSRFERDPQRFLALGDQIRSHVGGMP
jgi:xanthine dehydrogenase accessory factor